MEEVEQVRRGRSQAFDADGVQTPDRGDYLPLRRTARAGIQKDREGALIPGVLIRVRDPELGLPEESVIRALEDLPLLGDGTDHNFQGGAPVGVAKRAGLDLAHHLLRTPAD